MLLSRNPLLCNTYVLSPFKSNSQASSTSILTSYPDPLRACYAVREECVTSPKGVCVEVYKYPFSSFSTPEPSGLTTSLVMSKRVQLWSRESHFRLFLKGLAFRTHLSVENGYRKRNFSKTLSRVEILENAVFHVLV